MKADTIPVMFCQELTHSSLQFSQMISWVDHNTVVPFPKHRNYSEAQPLTNDQKLPWGTIPFKNEAGDQLAADKYGPELSHKSFCNERGSGDVMWCCLR